ncbi:diacylglycerol kinase [Geothermobacter hydrogeniphilus]|uniref:Diacylglycerol kinase n=1 Tax=Geothermobacter hydrogeniphilus TaxID=1969733 RepID=A0A2K2H5G7_9BACT|nr:diacylglycerol kinase family protein [Geothermobacter hydrogeniphilus]PNU18575.1 diacylglycerol kinase [Geothermobacter hydrogeniphilus]
MMRLLLIANPVAGGDARPRIDRALKLLRDAGAEVELAQTTATGDAERWAGEAGRESRYQRVLVAGGDGTLNEAANGLVGSDLPLAFLPLGTTNVFALETGLPTTTENLCRLALEGKPRPIHLGRAGERYFLLMAGLGFDAEAVRLLRPGLKQRLGKGAYLVSALQTLLRFPPFPLEIETDSGHFCGHGAIISNARLYGGPFSFTPAAGLFSDRFEVCLFQQWNRRTLLRHALALLRRRPLDPRRVKIFSCRRISIKSPQVPVQLDGDFFCHTPLDLDIGSTCLQMILP